jgi:Flp pilus assembly CpaE family ATPase
MQARGGDGATTLALHVAAGLTEAKKQRVLLIDLDFHSGALDFRLGLKPESTVVDALGRVDEIDDLWNRLKTPWKMFDVLPSPPSTRTLPAKTLQFLPALLDYLLRVYPVVVVDMPPEFFSSYPEIASLLDSVYVVATPQLTSLHLARRRLLELEASGLQNDQIKAILNRFGSNRKILTPGEIEKALGMPISAQIDNDFEAARAASFQADLVPAGSRLGRQFAGVARLIIGMENKKRPLKSLLARLIPVAT